MSKFYDVTRRLLNERVESVKQGRTFPFTDLRHFYYECRNKFLRENPQLNEPDVESKSPYSDWENAVGAFCRKHCEEFGVPNELYWRVREKLNIWAEGKAVCEGESGKFLVDKDTRERTAKDCSFILLCEKKTVSRELLERLKSEGYKVNLVSTGGHSPSDIQEAVLHITEDLDDDEPAFYFLVLHDFDLDGVKIFFNLKERYVGVVDVGVNSELTKWLVEQGNFDSRLVEEQKLNRNFQRWLKGKIEGEESAYSIEDFEYLQGVKQPNGKEWIGKRIEIDAIHVQYGIEPFVQYIKKKIEEECPYWDLTRIGVTEFELTEPTNPFESTSKNLRYQISEKHDNAWRRISAPLLKVDKFVASVTSEFGDEIEDLVEEQGIKSVENMRFGDGLSVYDLDREDMNLLKKKYASGFERKYLPDFEEKLEELNENIHKYDGDITTAKEDIESEKSDLQEEVNGEASNDKEAKEFEEELNQIDWGEEKFDELEIPDEKEVIQTVIDRLQQRLKELKAESE
jgi:hypothetical protein